MSTGIIYSCKLGNFPSVNHNYSLTSLLRHNCFVNGTRPNDFSNIGSPLFLDLSWLSLVFLQFSWRSSLFFSKPAAGHGAGSRCPRMCQALWLRHCVACMSTVHGAHTAVRYEIFTFSLEFPYKKIPMRTGIIYACKLKNFPSLNHNYSLTSLLMARVLLTFPILGPLCSWIFPDWALFSSSFPHEAHFSSVSQQPDTGQGPPVVATHVPGPVATAQCGLHEHSAWSSHSSQIWDIHSFIRISI